MGESTDSQRTRWVTSCGILDCGAPPTQLITYILLGTGLDRVALVCDRHAEHYAAYHRDTEPLLRPIPLSPARTVPVNRIMPGTQVLDIDDKEWQEREAWRWVVRSVARPAQRVSASAKVRWVYADRSTQDFDESEQVTGWFTPLRH